MFMVRSLITGFDDYANILFPLVDLESSLIGVREASFSCSMFLVPVCRSRGSRASLRGRREAAA